MCPKVSLKDAVLPSLMSDDQPELCAGDVAGQGHELLCRRELVKVWACEVVGSLCYWEGLFYKVLGDALHSTEESQIDQGAMQLHLSQPLSERQRKHAAALVGQLAHDSRDSSH